MPITVSTAIADLLDSANAPAALTALGAEAAGAAAAAQAASQPVNPNLTAYAAGPTAAITAALQGAEDDPTRIGTEYLPEVLAGTSVELADTSPLILPARTLGSDSFGNLVIHDGVTLGGKMVSDPATAKFKGTVIVTELELDTSGARLLGEFPLSAQKAVAGSILRIRGQMWLISSAATVTPRLGISTSRQRVLTSGIISNATLSGVVPSVSDLGTAAIVNIDISWQLAVSGEYLNLTNLSGTTPNCVASTISSGISIQTQTSATISANTLFTPSVNESVRIYLGWPSSTSTTQLRVSYNIEVNVE